MDIGKAIREIQAEKGISNGKLAGLLKVSPARISQYRSQKHFKLETVRKIADALNVPMGMLMRLE